MNVELLVVYWSCPSKSVPSLKDSDSTDMRRVTGLALRDRSTNGNFYKKNRAVERYAFVFIDSCSLPKRGSLFADHCMLITFPVNYCTVFIPLMLQYLGREICNSSGDDLI